MEDYSYLETRTDKVERTSKYVKYKEGVKEIKKVDYFRLGKSESLGKNIITLVFPIDKDKTNYITDILSSNVIPNININDTLTVDKRAVRIYGDTSELSIELTKGIIVDSLNYFSFKDMKNRLVNTDDGFCLRTEYVDKMDIIKVGIAMIGNPKYAVIINISEIMFKQYIAVIKQN